MVSCGSPCFGSFMLTCYIELIVWLLMCLNWYLWEVREQFDFLVLKMEKGPRNSNQIVAIFFICPRGGHLGFQNGRHFQHVLAETYFWQLLVQRRRLFSWFSMYFVIHFIPLERKSSVYNGG